MTTKAKVNKQGHLTWQTILHRSSVSKAEVISALDQGCLMDRKQIKGNCQTTDYSCYVYINLQYFIGYSIYLSYFWFYNTCTVYFI